LILLEYSSRAGCAELAFANPPNLIRRHLGPVHPATGVPRGATAKRIARLRHHRHFGPIGTAQQFLTIPPR